MRGYVIQRSNGAAQPASRYYLLAPDETSALASAAKLLDTDIERLTVLRGMADWEIQVFCPSPDELLAAP